MQQLTDALTTAQAQQAGFVDSFESAAPPAVAVETDTSSFITQNNNMQAVEGNVIAQQNLNVTATRAGSVTQETAADWSARSTAAMAAFGQVESQLAQDIVDRSELLQRHAADSAWETAILTVIVLWLIAGAAMLVARSLVLPLRRLRAGALEVASVGLPQRVRELSESTDLPQPVEIAPIAVLSVDEIGQVARAFDLVHREAVRLAGNEASLRASLNAMFVSLSRRSQSLIERLSRMIDALELQEGDPDRLSSLFAMDHLITRMRRNSENLLVLAGHEGARKRSDPVLLGDVARAAASEIEQYGRVVLNIQPGIEVAGQASTDVVHLLAELIENATMYSSRETEVFLTAQELSTGGVLIEVTDSGVGVSESRLEHLNAELDEPPLVDVSVSRHMGLFVVSHLAARHGIAVRLRPSSPAGVVAMIWLPHTVAAKSTIGYGERLRRLGAGRATIPVDPIVTGGHTGSRHSGPQFAAAAMSVRLPGTTEYGTPEYGTPAYGTPAARGPMTGQGAMTGQPTPNWFKPRLPSGGQDRTPGGQPRVPSDVPRSDSRYQRQASQGQEPEQRGQWGSQQDAVDQPWGLAGEAPEPVSGGTTGAGLPVRVPQANRVPSGQPAGAAHGHDSRLSGATTAPLPAPPAVQRRSPEAARSRLSGFQHGTRRAEAHGPRSGEGSDR